jgi:hypothetical protein
LLKRLGHATHAPLTGAKRRTDKSTPSSTKRKSMLPCSFSLITHPALGAKEKVRVLAQGSQRKRFSCRVAAWFNWTF